MNIEKYGEILGVVISGEKPVAIRERDWFRLQSRAVVMASGCHEWMGAKIPNGYGLIGIGGRMVYTHRVAYAVAHGGIPAGLIVRHRCDNPGCVNPDHLEVGTQQDNVNDKMERGRQRYANGKTTKLSDADVRRIRELRAEGWTLQRIADEFGCSIAQVHHIVSGKSRKGVK